MTNIFDKIREQYKDKKQLFNDMVSAMHIDIEKTRYNYYLLYDCDLNEYLDDGLCDSEESVIERLDGLLYDYYLEDLRSAYNLKCNTFEELLKALEFIDNIDEYYYFDIAVIMLITNTL